MVSKIGYKIKLLMFIKIDNNNNNNNNNNNDSI